MPNDEAGPVGPKFYPWQKRFVDQGKKILPTQFYEMYSKYGEGGHTVKDLCAEYGISRARFYQLRTRLELYMKTGLKTKEIPKQVREMTDNPTARTFNLRELKRGD